MVEDTEYLKQQIEKDFTKNKRIMRKIEQKMAQEKI